MVGTLIEFPKQTNQKAHNSRVFFDLERMAHDSLNQNLSELLAGIDDKFYQFNYDAPNEYFHPKELRLVGDKNKKVY